MTVRNRLRAWWFNVHQRGVFIHCEGIFLSCFVDNVMCMTLGRELTWADWPCRWHNKAVEHHGMQYADDPVEAAEWRAEYGRQHARMDEEIARARRIRQLGWGR